MGMQVNFPDELGAWIRHNLERGCADASIVEALVAQRFEPAVAQGLVRAFRSAREAGTPPPSGAIVLETEDTYRYETPRLASGPVIRASGREIPVLARLQRPLAAVLGGVLDAEECAQVIELARGRLRPSTVVDPASGEDTVAKYRDSEGMFFCPRETPFIARLEQRLAAVMNCPPENGEGLQVLRYGPGAHTAPHFDFLVPGNEANRASLVRSGQRVSTLLIYLNDVEQGGETHFPEAGFSMVPVRGNGLYFEYANSLRQVDLLSAHAGLPVGAGEKWVMTKWMRERRFVSA